MRITAIVVIMLALVIAACSTTEQRLPVGNLDKAPFVESYDSALVLAAVNGRHILVDYYTDW